jgi:hypothetical protein
MPIAFRVSAGAGDSIGYADTLDEVLELAKGADPGRYRIEKIWLDPATGELRMWEWGEISKDASGGIKLDLPASLD